MIWKVRVEAVNEASHSVVMSPLPCEACVVINCFKSYTLCEVGPFEVVGVLGGFTSISFQTASKKM